MLEASDILKIIQENDIKIDSKHLKYEEPLKDQGLDSLDLITILFSLEEIYHLKISEDDIDKGRLESINAIVEYINSKKDE